MNCFMIVINLEDWYIVVDHSSLFFQWQALLFNAIMMSLMNKQSTLKSLKPILLQLVPYTLRVVIQAQMMVQITLFRFKLQAQIYSLNVTLHQRVVYFTWKLQSQLLQKKWTWTQTHSLTMLLQLEIQVNQVLRMD